MKPPRSTTNPYRGTLSVNGVAKLWRVPRRVVRRAIARGELPFVEIAGRIRVPREAAPRQNPVAG